MSTRQARWIHQGTGLYTEFGACGALVVHLYLYVISVEDVH